MGWRGIKRYVSVHEIKLMTEAAGGRTKERLYLSVSVLNRPLGCRFVLVMVVLGLVENRIVKPKVHAFSRYSFLVCARVSTTACPRDGATKEITT